MRPLTLIVPALLLLPGCMVWTRPAPVATVLNQANDRPLQVTRTDHSVIVIRSASVQGDSLIGIAADGSNARVGVPIAEIKGVSTRDVSTGRTLALTGGVVLGALGVLFIAVIIALSTANWGG